MLRQVPSFSLSRARCYYPAGSLMVARIERGSRVGRYEVEDLIATAGMGTGYRARDTELGGTVAIKVFSQGNVADPVVIRRFRSEAAIVRAITSPHVVRILDVGIEQG